MTNWLVSAVIDVFAPRRAVAAGPGRSSLRGDGARAEALPRAARRVPHARLSRRAGARLRRRILRPGRVRAQRRVRRAVAGAAAWRYAYPYASRVAICIRVCGCCVYPNARAWRYAFAYVAVVCIRMLTPGARRRACGTDARGTGARRGRICPCGPHHTPYANRYASRDRVHSRAHFSVCGPPMRCMSTHVTHCLRIWRFLVRVTCCKLVASAFTYAFLFLFL